MANEVDRYFNAQADEIQRLRRLVDVRADFHLDNWGRWRRAYVGTRGYDKRSAGLSSGGISGNDAFEHLCEDLDEYSAEVSDVAIDELPVIQRIAIQHVYEASVWTFARGNLDSVLMDGVKTYWAKASRRDLT
jgi:hypothetical protein